VILSEDFSDGMVVEGIRTVNPFAAGFQVRDWI
jgi:predicted nucleic acid-binding protein